VVQWLPGAFPSSSSQYILHPISRWFTKKSICLKSDVSNAAAPLPGVKSGPRFGSRFGFAAIAVSVTVRNRLRFKNKNHESDFFDVLKGALNTEKLTMS